MGTKAISLSRLPPSPFLAVSCRQQLIDLRTAPGNGTYDGVAAQRQALGVDERHIGDADETEDGSQVRLLEVHGFRGSMAVDAAAGGEYVGRLVGQQADGTVLAVPKGHAGSRYMVDPGLERGTDGQVVHRRPDHEHVGGQQLPDQFIRQPRVPRLRLGALARRCERGAERLLGEVRRRIAGQVALDDAIGRMRPSPRRDETAGEMSGNRAFPADAAIDAKHGGHAVSFVNSRQLWAVQVARAPGTRHCATHPPSTLIDAPRIWSAAGEHRKTAVAPICSGVANSSEGCFSASSLSFACSGVTPSRMAAASICACTSGVNTHPGQIALQVTGERAVSSATTLVKPSSPCFAATYAALVADATTPCAEAMLTMRPKPRRLMCGKAVLMAWNADERLIARIRSHCSSGNASTAAVCWTPALFTTTSTPPKRATHCSTIALTCPGRDASAVL